MSSIYTLGCIVTFALMGWSFGENSGIGRESAAVLGGVVGWALGNAFAPNSKAKPKTPAGKNE